MIEGIQWKLMSLPFYPFNHKYRYGVFVCKAVCLETSNAAPLHQQQQQQLLLLLLLLLVLLLLMHRAAPLLRGNAVTRACNRKEEGLGAGRKQTTPNRGGKSKISRAPAAYVRDALMRNSLL
jgi:hypothetical protein